MNINHITLLIALYFSAFFTAPAFAADEYLEVSQKACNHLKHCAKQKMSEIPQEYRQMIEASLSSMCQTLPSADSIPGFGKEHPVYAPAIACMKSITSLSCEQINDSGASTPACEKLSNM